MKRRDLLLAGLVVVFLATLILPGHQGGERPAADVNRAGEAPEIVAPAEQRVVYRLDEFDAVRQRKEHKVQKGRALRFAEATEVSITPASHGIWSVANGHAQWELEVDAPGALNLNFGFGRYTLPPSAVLEFRGRDGERLVRPFTAEDNEEHGELWTPLFAGESVEVVLTVAVGERDAVQLEMSSINRGFREMRMAAGYLKIGSDPSNGNCHVDVVCSAAQSGVGVVIDQYRDQIRSAGVYTLAGVDTCSGSLVNNTAQDGTPYFLTADHCGVTAGNDSTMVVYWNFQNSWCRTPGSVASGQDGNGPITQFNTGATLRATHPLSDFALVELDDPIDAAWSPYFSGWSRSTANPSMAVSVHHPNISEKRISFEFDALQSTDENSNTPDFGGSHWRVFDWDFGSTEGGSSGSPLYDQNGRVVGQLSGGLAACGNNESDWYGKFSRNWTGGGTPTTRLSNWLDPAGLNPVTLDGTDGLVGVSIAAAEVIETNSGTTTMQFTMQLSEAAEEVIQVSYTAQSATASAGSDFVQVTNTVTFSVGQSTKPVVITINGDTTPEEHETFRLVLSLVGSPAAILTTPFATGTILNDDYIVPVITGPTSVNGAVSKQVGAVVTAMNTPTAFSLSDEPAGMTIDNRGVISWVPSSSGSFPVTVTASNPAGSVDGVITFVIAGNPLAESIDAEGGYAVSTGGTSNWTRNVSSDSIRGTNRAQSGIITHNQSTWMEIEAEGPDYLGFWWKVSSEAFFDALKLSVDGVVQDEISGTVGWNYRLLVLGPGTHTVRWTYSKDESDSVGSDRGWVDSVQLASTTVAPFLMEPPVVHAAAGQAVDYQYPTLQTGVAFGTVVLSGSAISNFTGAVVGTPAAAGDTNYNLRMTLNGLTLTAPATLSVQNLAPIGNAVEQPNLLWTRTGSGSWLTSSTSRQNGDSAQESGVGNSGRGELSTVVTGPGTVSFWWKVSSEADYDYLVFEVNGVELDAISGEVGWTPVTVDLGFGQQVLTWAYEKDVSDLAGLDTGWVDEISFGGYAGWAIAQGLGGRSNPIFNLDGDELNQWFEYATGGSATSYDLRPAPVLVNGAMEWTVNKPTGLGDDVFFDAEVSDDLVEWGKADRTILQDDAARFRARDNLGVSGEGQRYMRGVTHPTR